LRSINLSKRLQKGVRLSGAHNTRDVPKALNPVETTIFYIYMKSASISSHWSCSCSMAFKQKFLSSLNQSSAA